MKPTNVLLLNLNPSRELSNSLRRIIESAQHADLRLQQETIDNNDSLSSAETAVPDLVSRANPAVIFLVSSWNYLKRAKSLFPSLRRSPPEPPVVVVSDTDAPDDMFEMIKLGAADFITTPLTPIGILPRLWRLLEQTCWGETLAHRLKEKFCGTKMLIGESPAFVAAANKVPLVAKCTATIYARSLGARPQRLVGEAHGARTPDDRLIFDVKSEGLLQGVYRLHAVVTLNIPTAKSQPASSFLTNFESNIIQVY